MQICEVEFEECRGPPCQPGILIDDSLGLLLISGCKIDGGIFLK